MLVALWMYSWPLKAWIKLDTTCLLDPWSPSSRLGSCVNVLPTKSASASPMFSKGGYELPKPITKSTMPLGNRSSAT